MFLLSELLYECESGFPIFVLQYNPTSLLKAGMIIPKPNSQ